MNQPLTDCCNAPYDKNGRCSECGQYGFIETKEEDEEW